MARIVISEYAAKRLLYDDKYKGISVSADSDISLLSINKGKYAVKVDDGTKKRNKKGLVELGLSEKEVEKQVQTHIDAGYERVLIEPQMNHDEKDERYLSCTLVREGVSVLYSSKGGNNVEEKNSEIESYIIPLHNFLDGITPKLEGVPNNVLELLLSAMKQYHFSFIEINPFVLTNTEEVAFLDAAVELDSSKLHALPEWVIEQVQEKIGKTEIEAKVSLLDEQSTSSFSLTVLNRNASVFTLLSGGGASLVMLDALVDNGLQDTVGNYGEYSGAPTREETRIYTSILLSLLFASEAEKKVLVIAGGVANFTDVTTTFQGIVDSCIEHLEEFKKHKVLVLVRRGGPRQAEGIALLNDFFTTHNISAKVSGPEVSFSEVARNAKKYIEN
ncbi:hypothetical protein KC960_05210 [Candidatus Saccharibacteria bacterium]|nr:hypothetical protein [Candidatus Saccharibacteria bacterium]